MSYLCITKLGKNLLDIYITPNAFCIVKIHSTGPLINFAIDTKNNLYIIITYYIPSPISAFDRFTTMYNKYKTKVYPFLPGASIHTSVCSVELSVTTNSTRGWALRTTLSISILLKNTLSKVSFSNLVTKCFLGHPRTSEDFFLFLHFWLTLSKTSLLKV